MNILFKFIIITVFTILLNLFQAFSYAEIKPSGRIIERHGEIVTLNIGYDAGVKLGMKFSAYRIDKQILLPLSGEQTIISSNEIIGEIQITKVENNTSSGKILIEDNEHKIVSLCYVQEAEKQTSSNHLPIISSISFNPDYIIPRKQVEVKVDVSDPDSDPLIYTWKADRGYFLSDNTVTPVNCWIAPSEKGNFTIIVSISDQRSGYDEMKRTITVKNPDWFGDLGDYLMMRTFKNNVYSEHDSNVLNVLDVAFDSKNNMYILDPREQCISVFDPNGRYLKSLCVGRFSLPNKFLIDDDKLYVIYDNNRSVERYDLMGNQEVTYSKKETSKHEIDVLRKPIAFAVSNEGELYVIDGIGPNIAVFEKNGRFRLRFGNNATERGELVNPVAVCVDRGGYVYVLDSGKGEIIVYNPKMQYQRSIKLKTGEINDIYLDKTKNQFYLVNIASKNILIINSSGNTINEFGALINPHTVTMDKYSNIYVTNKIESYAYKFTHKENTYKYYGKFGTNPFTKIVNIGVDKEGSIFLLNEPSSEIIKVDKNGWELTRFGGKDEDERLKKPISIVAGEGGKYIYVLDNGRNEVLQFSNSGKFLRIVASQKDGRVKKPIDIDSDKEGNLYVLDATAGVCFVYNYKGEFLAQIGTKGKKKELEYLYYPTKVAVEPDGEYVYIFDDNSKLRKINVYVKKDAGSAYPYLRYDKVSEGISVLSALKVNNYNQLMVAFTSEANLHGINYFGRNRNLERTLTGKDSFMTIKDIEVDDVENIYVLNTTGNVYIFKQERLLQQR